MNTVIQTNSNFFYNTMKCCWLNAVHFLQGFQNKSQLWRSCRRICSYRKTLSEWFSFKQKQEQDIFLIVLLSYNTLHYFSMNSNRLHYQNDNNSRIKYNPSFTLQINEEETDLFIQYIRSLYLQSNSINMCTKIKMFTFIQAHLKGLVVIVINLF